MTVENTNCRVDYNGDDLTTDFPTTFAFLDDSHLVVKVSSNGGTTWTTLTLGADYNVSGAGDPEPGGTVSMLSTPTSSETLRIERHTPITQELALQTSGPIPAKSIVAEFDKLTMIAQENARDIADLAAGTTGSTYTAVQVTDTFTVLNPIESTFPRSVAAGVAPKTVVIGRIENLTDPTEVLDQPPSLQWAPSGNNISVKRIDDLTVGDQYRITYEVRA